LASHEICIARESLPSVDDNFWIGRFGLFDPKKSHDLPMIFVDFDLQERFLYVSCPSYKIPSKSHQNFHNIWVQFRLYFQIRIETTPVLMAD
jgi:hypothetical protein